MPRFKEMPHDPNQLWLLPPSLNELLDEEAGVRVLGELMDCLDWSNLEDDCLGPGRPCYPPRVMTKILVYAYCNGIRSSRKIEELIRCDIGYMWLSGGLKPDFHTIARFRKENFASFAGLFAESVRLCKSAGLVLMHVVSVDGSKLEANASRASVYDKKRLDRELEAVEKILREADEVDAAEDAKFGESNGREIPEDLKDAKKRREKLKELTRKLRESGSKYISSSDDECRMMKTRDGVRPAYNVRIAVDSEHQVIAATDVIQAEVDHGRLPPMLAEVKKNTGG